MAEMILPGVYIEVRPEGLIVPGRITVGNVGVVGTAAKGPINKPVLLGSYTEAVQRFYGYDSWIDPSTGQKRANELTLVRALEQALSFGATTVYAVRVAASDAVKSSRVLKSGANNCVTLTAKWEGTWGDDLSVNISTATDHAFIEDEVVPTSGAGSLTLKRIPVIASARNRVQHFIEATGVTRTVQIVYNPAAATTGQVQINLATGALTFPTTETPAAADKLTASYVVDKSKSIKVTLRLDRAEEIYTSVDGNDLAEDINRQSAWVDASPDSTHGIDLPDKNATPDDFAAFSGGKNGEANANYQSGLDALLNEDVHIIVAAGQDDSFSSALNKHCQLASTDAVKHDRIAVIGTKLGDPTKPDEFFDYLRGHNLDSDRVLFVAPGIQATDAAAEPPATVTLSGAYAAAAVAGLLASYSPHISLTNKVLSVDGLERRFTSAELTQLVQSRVLTLEQRQGFRIVQGITTSTNTAWHQITTRRIVDYAKFGVRSAATPYIGLLNNKRVRAALKTTINSFLAEMVDDEMLVSYELDVTATRDEERKGICRVTMVVRPTFSIDFIKVTMFLE